MYFCPQITLPLKILGFKKLTSIEIRIQLTSRDILDVWWSVLDNRKLLYYSHTMWKAGKLVKGSSINIIIDWLVTNRGLITETMILFIIKTVPPHCVVDTIVSYYSIYYAMRWNSLYVNNSSWIYKSRFLSQKFISYFV